MTDVSVTRVPVLTFTAAWGQAALADQYTIPLLVPAGTSSEPQGVLRILNGTNESRTVEIFAIDGGSQTRSTSTMSSSRSGLNSATGWRSHHTRHRGFQSGV